MRGTLSPRLTVPSRSIKLLKHTSCSRPTKSKGTSLCSHGLNERLIEEGQECGTVQYLYRMLQLEASGICVTVRYSTLVKKETHEIPNPYHGHSSE